MNNMLDNLNFQKDRLKLNIILSNRHVFKYIVENLDKIRYKLSSRNNINLMGLQGDFDYLHDRNIDYFLFNKSVERYNSSIVDYLIDDYGISFNDLIKCLEEKRDYGTLYDFIDGFIKRGHKELMFLKGNYKFDPSIDFENIVYLYDHLKNISIPPFEIIKFYSRQNKPINKLFNNNSEFLDYIINLNVDDDFLNTEPVINMVMEELDSSSFSKIIYLFNKRNVDNYPSKFKELLTYAYDLSSSTGKVNTLENNSSITYDLLEYAYPNLDKKIVLELIKFDTQAPEMVASLIKDGHLNYVKSIIDLINKYNLCSNSPSSLHTVFMNLTNYFDLLIDIINSNQELSDKDVNNLNNIILNVNLMNITTLEQLKNYDNFLLDRVKYTINLPDGFDKYVNILKIFGFSSEHNFTFFNRSFNNTDFLQYSKVLNDLKDRNIDISNLLLTKEDIVILKLLESFKDAVSKVNYELCNSLLNYMISNNLVLDFTTWRSNFEKKLRRLYNTHMKSTLTDPNNIKGERTKTDGVTVIDYSEGKFNFLAHCIYNYDPHVSGYDKMITDNPSLWTKLEGVSTLSTSCISDKNMSIVSDKTDGITYLFSEIPDNFLLYMDRSDLYTQHGQRILNPTAQACSFTTLDALNYRTNGSYNEVSGYREGMIPTAILCVGDNVYPNAIKAAKYFSELRGKEVPIIRMNPDRIRDNNEEIFNNIRQKYNNSNPPKINMEDIKELIYRSNNDKIDNVIRLILKTLLLNLKANLMTYTEFIAMISNTKREVSLLDENAKRFLGNYETLFRNAVKLKEQELTEEFGKAL